MQQTEDVSAFISFDNPFTIAAAALIGSILQHKSLDYKLNLYISNVGVRGGYIGRLNQMVRHRPDVNLIWLKPDEARRRKLQQLYANAETHYPPAAYSRLIIGDLLPNDVTKVIYLDVDMILRTDIARLWAVPMNGMVALAAIDPLVAAKGSMALCGVPTKPSEKDHRYSDHLARLVASYGLSDLSFDGDDTYFQSGILVIDLDRYRALDCATRLIETTDRMNNLSFPDQDALNIVLRKKIGTLDPRWNMVATLYDLKDGGASPYGPEVMDKLLRDPWVVHFTSRPKPWHLGCSHPFLHEWQKALEPSAWSGWRPNTLNQFLARLPRGWRILKKNLGRAFA